MKLHHFATAFAATALVGLSAFAISASAASTPAVTTAVSTTAAPSTATVGTTATTTTYITHTVVWNQDGTTRIDVHGQPFGSDSETTSTTILTCSCTGSDCMVYQDHLSKAKYYEIPADKLPQMDLSQSGTTVTSGSQEPPLILNDEGKLEFDENPLVDVSLTADFIQGVKQYYAVGEELDLSGLDYLCLVYQYMYNTYVENVSNCICFAETNFDASKPGHYRLNVGIGKEVKDWGGIDQLTIDLFVYDNEIIPDSDIYECNYSKDGKVVACDYKGGCHLIETYEVTDCTDITESYETHVITGNSYSLGDVIYPAECSTVTSTCLADSDQPVWDENGHYRGTNALFSTHLEMVTSPKTDYIVGESLDLSAIKLYYVETRRFNTWAYDVSSKVKIINTNFNNNHPGNFFIELGADFSIPEAYGECEPIRISLTVKNPDSTDNEDIGMQTTPYTTIATDEKGRVLDENGEVLIVNGTSAVCSVNTTTTTTTTTVTTLSAKLFNEDGTPYGDANRDNETDISDVILLYRAAAEDKSIDYTVYGQNFFKHADINEDGKITSADAVLVLLRIARLI